MPLTSAHLTDRAILEVSGEDRVEFLQGLVSNDIARVTPEHAVFAAFLTAQGKFLHDFFVLDGGEGVLWLDLPADALADLHRRLRLYKLRSKVMLTGRDDLSVAALWGTGVGPALALPTEPGAAGRLDGAWVFVDPRHPAMGARLVASADGLHAVLGALSADAAGSEAYEAHRLAQGVPDGYRDGVKEKSTLLELGYDTLNAISWDKGCYMGQELTARTRYRGLLKRRLLPVRVDGPVPDPGTPVTRDGRVVGEIRTGGDGLAIAHLRLDALGGDEAVPLLADGRAVTLRPAPSRETPETIERSGASTVSS